MTDYDLFRGTDRNGNEYLLTVWPDGARELAMRAKGSTTWGPPLPMTEVAVKA